VSAANEDSGVPHGALLIQFVEAVLGDGAQGDARELEHARQAIHSALGLAAFVDVCATVASFNAVVKIADGTGIPLEADKAERTKQLRAGVGIDRFQKTTP